MTHLSAIPETYFDFPESEMDRPVFEPNSHEMKNGQWRIDLRIPNGLGGLKTIAIYHELWILEALYESWQRRC